MPIQLGCCPEAERCLLCPPTPQPPAIDTLRALIGHYRAERLGADDTLSVGFFGGPPPPPPLLQAAAGLPLRVRVRPDLLSRAEADRLIAAGVVSIELDAWTFQDHALRACGRHYRSDLLRSMLEGLAALPIELGIVLAPGLPDTSHDSAVADAELAARWVDTARLHPVLVLAEAGLREYHILGTYEPLSLGQAITTCRAQLDLLEAAGVTVTRIGLQPGPDGFGRAVAGPRHSALRQLVEARRVLDQLHPQVASHAGSAVQIRCAPADETRTRGPMNQHLRELRAAHGLTSLQIAVDPTLQRGTWIVKRADG